MVNGFPVWDEEFDKKHFTANEILESDIEASIILAIISAREDQGLSQRALEALTGIKQPAIARIEKGTNSPTIETVTKLLKPLGKKLAVVPID